MRPLHRLVRLSLLALGPSLLSDKAPGIHSEQQGADRPGRQPKRDSRPRPPSVATSISPQDAQSPTNPKSAPCTQENRSQYGPWSAIVVCIRSQGKCSDAHRTEQALHNGAQVMIARGFVNTCIKLRSIKTSVLC